MTHRRLAAKKFILVFGDVMVSLLALGLALLIRHGGAPELFLVHLYIFAAPFLIVLWLAGFLIFGLYDLKTAKNNPAFFERLAKALFFDFTVTVLLFYFIPEFRLRPLVTLAVIFFSLAVLAFGWRAAFNAILSRRSKERVLFLGVNQEALEVARFINENPQLGFVPVAYLVGEEATENFGEVPNGDVRKLDDNLYSTVKELGINRVVVTSEFKNKKTPSRELLSVVPLGVTVVDLPRFYEAVKGKIPVSLISAVWFFENLIGAKRPKYEMAKRFLDLTFVFVFGAAGLILLPFIAAAIFLSTPKDILNHREKRAREGDGFIFFRQKRMGQNGQVFDLVKFRSQVLGAERMGSLKNMPEDPRSYPVGGFLRKNYLDELPQLLNVLKGEMSFVGPRPERPEFAGQLEKQIPFYRMRELVLPGLTGWAQINMENDASVEDAPEKMQYDLYYIKNRSIFLDTVILLKTALKLLQRSGR